MLSGINPAISDEVNRQSSAIAKRREQLRRWDESETNRESSNIKLSQRVKFEQAYIFLAACSSEDQDEIDKLLQRGVDINTSNIDGLTALHQSCIDNNLYMVEYLLNRSADINCQDNEGWTPLHAAASCGNIDIVKYLLSHGAIVDACNNEGELAIDIAEDDEIIVLLEEDMRRKGIDDQQSRNYEHQLMIKHAQDSFNNNKNGLKSSSDAIVHARTGATALHVAAAKGYLDVIELLIRAGANVNAIDNDGWTPLHAGAHWDKHDVMKYLIERNADLDAKNYAGQTPLDVCDGETFQLLKELKEKHPSIKNKSIVNKSPQPIIDENSPHLQDKLSHLQRSLHDLSNRYTKVNQDESLLNSSNFPEEKSKENLSSLSTNSQRIFTNPLQSLTTRNFHLNQNNDSFNREHSPHVIPSPSQPLDSKMNQSINETQPEVTPRRWGTTDRTVGDIANNTGPYVRRRSGVGVNETNSPSPSFSSASISVTSSLPPSTPNVTVTSSSNPIDDSKKRINRGDEEAEAQRKHRSAQARRERRSTQSVTVEDIKAAEQQIKSRSNEMNELSNNQIGAPSTPLANHEHDIETERLQKVIEEKKDQVRNETNPDESHRINTRIPLTDEIPTITANDSLNLPENQQQRRRTNRVHNNQRKNTGRIIWNDQTKEVEIRDDIKSNEGSDDQQSTTIGSRGLISRFENNPIKKINRSQSQEPTQKSLTMTNSLSDNGINSTVNQLYHETKKKMDDLNQKVERLERDLLERDQIIEKLKTSQYIESSLDKREKRGYERKISELEEDLKKMDSVKSDNTRLKEENAALIRVISKLSK